MRINTISKTIVSNDVTVEVPECRPLTVTIYGRLNPQTMRMVVRRYLLDEYNLGDDCRVQLENGNFVISNVDTSEDLWECYTPDFIHIAHKVTKRTR